MKGAIRVDLRLLKDCKLGLTLFKPNVEIAFSATAKMLKGGFP